MLFTDKLVPLLLDGVVVEGILKVPIQATGLVIYAHEGVANHASSHCRYLAKQLLTGDLGILCVDLLTSSELRSTDLSTNVELLTRRLLAICQWAQKQPALHGQRLGLLASGVSATAALKVAVMLGKEIGAVVTFAGHLDLITSVIASVKVPTLLLVSAELGSQWREHVQPALRKPGELHMITSADSSLREGTALQDVTKSAVAWYDHYLPIPAASLSLAAYWRLLY